MISIKRFHNKINLTYIINKMINSLIIRNMMITINMRITINMMIVIVIIMIIAMKMIILIIIAITDFSIKISK